MRLMEIHLRVSEADGARRWYLGETRSSMLRSLSA
jgi:hypothetical protein